jgi:hypothetical protein
MPDGGNRLPDAVAPRDAQLALEVQIRGGDEDMDAAAVRRCQRPSRTVDVAFVTARR